MKRVRIVKSFHSLGDERGVSIVDYLTVLSLFVILLLTAFLAIEDAVDERQQRTIDRVRTPGPCGGAFPVGSKECL